MNKNNKKVNAIIILIGNEILSGRTQDANVTFLSKWLNELGVRVEEVRVILDEQKVIVNCINEVRKNLNMYLLLEASVPLMMTLHLNL